LDLPLKAILFIWIGKILAGRLSLATVSLAKALALDLLGLLGRQRLKRGPFVVFNVVPCDYGLGLDKRDGIKPVQALRSWIRSVSQGCCTVC
jgi:hypothetical protein